MAECEAVFEAIVRMGVGPGGRAELPVEDLYPVVGPADDPDACFGPLIGILIDLAEAGRIEMWQKPDDSAAVVLSALSAERLGLKLMPDSSRWVREFRRRWGRRHPLTKKRRPSSRTVLESDLKDEDGLTRLDKVIDHRAREAVEELIAYERLAAMRGAFGAKRTRNEFDRMVPPGIVMMGVPAHPLPGQDRGPWAPKPEPSESDLKRGFLVPAEGRCWACHGLPLKPGYGCGVCNRWETDRLLTDQEREEAEREVEEAWAERRNSYPCRKGTE